MALSREWGVLSAFFAVRALRKSPEVAAVMRCRNCGSLYFDALITPDDLQRLYMDYRGDSYFRQRHEYEPWYSRKLNDAMGNDIALLARRQAMAKALAACGLTGDFKTALDHGGDRGQMLQDLKSAEKAVYDISGVAPVPGVVAVTAAAMAATAWDIILSCHVLEHLPNPGTCVAELVALGHPGTIYFFEVPDEVFTSYRCNGSAWQKTWLAWLVKQPTLFKLFDFLSTAIRVKFRRVLPGLFVALREHINFYSLPGLTKLLETHGLQILTARILPTGHIGVVAIKP
jgi:hypothetical protein